MSEDSYANECMRAELLGLQPPDEAEFERARSARLEAQQAELDAAEAALLEQQEEQLRGAGGKLDELNSILSSTQQKLNRFKQTACGSITSMFGRGSSMDVPAVPAEASSSTEHSAELETQLPEPQPQPESELPPGEIQPAISTERIRAAKEASQQRMNSQLDKLDALINKADNAHVAMSEQTKQMRKMAK